MKIINNIAKERYIDIQSLSEKINTRFILFIVFFIIIHIITFYLINYKSLN